MDRSTEAADTPRHWWRAPLRAVTVTAVLMLVPAGPALAQGAGAKPAEDGGQAATTTEGPSAYLELPTTTQAASPAAASALAWAYAQLGDPYVWGAAGPDAYDCSGLVMRAYEAAGVYLPRTSQAQWAATARMPLSQLQPGDLVFWSPNGSASGIHHVGIYAGNWMRVHTPRPGRSVEYVPMWDGGLLPYGGRVW